MNTPRGFTLIEILATLVFISIVAGTLLTLFMSANRQQQQAKELELARAWLMAELAMQRVHYSLGACQAESPFATTTVICVVRSHGTNGAYDLVRITLIDEATVPARSVATVVGIAGVL